MKLILGNKNYSSWSMRPWLALKAAGIAFEEEVVSLDAPDRAAAIAAVSPSGRVPVLVDGDLVIPESIAIIEYAAEIEPSLWPAERPVRARARAIAAEMHAGFASLRSRCPMNLKRRPAAIALDPAVMRDVGRIVTIWTEAVARSGGPFLFGAADAMFAPVVNRFHAYGVPVPRATRDYMAAVMATPWWREWEVAALAETGTLPAIDAVA